MVRATAHASGAALSQPCTATQPLTAHRVSALARDRYHRFYTSETYTLGMSLLTYLVWANSADVHLNFSTADFVPLVSVIASLGHGVQQFCESGLTVMTSGELINYLSWLLNMDTEELRAARRKAAHQSAAEIAAVDGFVRACDAKLHEAEKDNKEDARHVARLIAMADSGVPQKMKPVTNKASPPSRPPITERSIIALPLFPCKGSRINAACATSFP